MQIAVISDTHMDSPPSWLDKIYSRWLAPADYLIHCGDITSPSTWSYFMQHQNFLCVRGNCDVAPQLVEELDPMLTARVSSLNIGVTHGWGPRPNVALKVAQAFGPEYDLVCYGHTHTQDWSQIEGIQLVNPGSLGDSGSLALVTIHDNATLSCDFLTLK